MNISILEGVLMLAALFIVAAMHVFIWAMCAAAGRSDDQAEKMRRRRCDNHNHD